jgi:hypothetical protein
MRRPSDELQAGFEKPPGTDQGSRSSVMEEIFKIAETINPTGKKVGVGNGMAWSQKGPS